MDKEQITLEDGRVGYKYPDGTIRNEKGHYVVAPPWKNDNWDSDTGTDAIVHRHKVAREAVAQGIMEATGTVSEADALQRTTKEVTDVILSNDEKGIAKVQAYKAVNQAAGYTRDKDAQQAGSVTINLPPGLRMAIGLETSDTGTKE